MSRGFNGRNLRSGQYNESVHKAPRGSKCAAYNCNNKADYEYDGLLMCDGCFYEADYL